MTGFGRVTLKDVAARAGVSVSAASLALAGKDRIPAETQARIRRAAADLGYTHNSAGRALRTQRHQAIALAVFRAVEDEGLSFFKEAVLAVADESLRHDYRLVLVNATASGDQSHGESPDRLLQLLQRASVDGAVCLGAPVDAGALRVLARRGFPFIFIGKREAPAIPVPYVATDYLGGMCLATEHLLRLGHQRVALAIYEGDADQPWMRDRIAGHTLAISGAGLPPDAGPVHVLPRPPTMDSTAEWQDAAWDVARWRREGITAVVAASHPTAVALLRRLHEHGVSVPDQMAVVGFDDPPAAASLLPPLTTVRQPLAALGTLAARTLLAWLEGAPKEPQTAILPATLVVRESCGARRAARQTNGGAYAWAVSKGTPRQLTSATGAAE